MVDALAYSSPGKPPQVRRVTLPKTRGKCSAGASVMMDRGFIHAEKRSEPHGRPSWGISMGFDQAARATTTSKKISAWLEETTQEGSSMPISEVPRRNLASLSQSHVPFLEGN